MEKIRKISTIYLPRNNHAKCPIYEHEGKFYIKANKPNTSSYIPFKLNGVEYSEVIVLGFKTNDEFWYKA